MTSEMMLDVVVPWRKEKVVIESSFKEVVVLPTQSNESTP